MGRNTDAGQLLMNSTASPVFFLRMFLLCIEPLLLLRCRNFCWNPPGLFLQCLPDQFFKPGRHSFLIGQLRAFGLRNHDQLTSGVYSVFQLFRDQPFLFITQLAALKHIEIKFYRCRNFVHVLPSFAAAAYGFKG